MHFKGRSLYNLLQISRKEDPSVQAEPWQLLDYRALSLEEIFSRLNALKIRLNQESFLIYADACDTPEELVDCLWIDEEDTIGEEKAYLLLFELWRRLVPEKQSLSIFFDELDGLLSRYDEGDVEEELLQKALSELEDLLDDSVDQGARPEEIFQSVTQYTAHDLEGFLYDYILELMDEESEVYASELIDGMRPYVTDKKWFDLLKARLFAMEDSPETDMLLSRLLEEAEEDPDLSFFMEVASFLVHRGDLSLFVQAVKKITALIKVEEELLEVLKMMADFYRCLDQDHVVNEIESLVEKRKAYSSDAPIDPKDFILVEKFLVSR